MLADKFWPGSLSILLPKSDLVPELITAGSSNVVLRVPNHPLTLELLNTLDFPLAAPSANISNTVSPTQAQHVIDSLGTSVSYILNGGDCSVGLESTIVAFEGENIVILREGGISQEEIQKETNFNVIANKNKSHESPGQLKKHYATSKPLYVVESINDFLYSNPNIKCSALVFFEQKLKCTKHLLSKDYNLSEIANSLFSIMRKADQDQTDCILVEMIKQEGIGRAIADRLNRASSIF